MKIVYVATSIIPSRTANSIHVIKMCQSFAQNGHEVTLLVPDRHDSWDLGAEDVFSFYGVERCFEIMQLPWFPIKLGRLNFGLFAAKKAKKLCPDLFYSRDVVASYFATFQGLHVCFESHAPVRDSGIVSDWIFRNLIVRPMFKKLVVITHALQDYYLDNYSIPSGKVQVAPDGADPVPHNITPIVFPNRSKKLQVGYIGHLYPGRGIDLIEQLATICHWADFHLVGGREQDIDACKKRTKNLDNLYVHGFKLPSETVRYCLGCDVLLAPYQHTVSTSGGRDTVRWMSPLKIFEYMAAGKAIIASDLPALREVLSHEKTALLCSPENVDAWVTALERFNNSEILRQQIGENACKKFLREHAWNLRAKKVLMEPLC